MMKDLKECREEIDAIDQQMMALFEKRMKLAQDVVTYKKAHHMEIFQSDREKEVIRKNVRRITQSSLHSYARSFLTGMMNISKSYQSTFLSPSLTLSLQQPRLSHVCVGFQGVEGSFSQKALQAYFQDDVQCQHYPHFQDVFEALKRDEIDYGIVPLENSSTGAINDNYDAIRDYGFYIVGEQSIAVSQHLLGIYGAKLEDIKEVYSHPQALMQSSLFLQEHSIRSHDYENTAMAAQYVSSLNQKSVGAIASLQAAKLYHLDVLYPHIQNLSNNATRFIVFAKNLEHSDDASCVSLVMTLPHTVGALYQIMKIINDHQINMLRIESRPLLSTTWEYYFYIDLQGHLKDERILQALQEMKAHTQSLRILGNYAKR